MNADLVIDRIGVGERLRPLSEPDVEKLMDSISKVGLLAPIIVWRPGGVSAKLVAGHHRLEACKRLGWDTIPCIILGTLEDADKAVMAEIAENLHRAELTALERSEHIAKWIQLAERVSVHDEQKSVGRPEGGISRAAREIGVQRVAASRAVKIAAITPEAKEAAQAAGLTNSQKALLEVAKAKTAEAQIAAVQDLERRRLYKPEPAITKDDPPNMRVVAHQLASKYSPIELDILIGHLSDIIRGA